MQCKGEVLSLENQKKGLRERLILHHQTLFHDLLFPDKEQEKRGMHQDLQEGDWVYCMEYKVYGIEMLQRWLEK